MNILFRPGTVAREGGLVKQTQTLETSKRERYSASRLQRPVRVRSENSLDDWRILDYAT
jgi:hypothetical protein